MPNLVEITVRTKGDYSAELRKAESEFKASGGRSGKGFTSEFSKQIGHGTLSELFGGGQGGVLNDSQRTGQNVGLGLSRGLLQKFQSTLGSGLLSGLFGTSSGTKLFGSAGNTVVQDATRQGNNIGQGFAKGLNDSMAGSGSKLQGILSGLFGGAGSGPDMSVGEQSGKDTGTGFLKGFAASLSSSSIGGAISNLFKRSGSGGKGSGSSTAIAGAAGGAANAASGIVGGAGPSIMGIGPGMASLVGLGGVLAGALPALTAVTAGLGTMAGGFLILDKTNKAFAADVKTTFSGIEKAIGQDAAPLIKPFEQSFSQLAGFVKSIGPELKNVFAAAGPLIQPFVGGLESLIKGLLPGLLSLLKAAKPAFDAFGSVLGTLGKDLGGMFSSFAPVLKSSGVLMKALLDVVSALFPILGKLGAIFATALAPVFKDFAGVIVSLLPALTTVGKVIAAFAGAVIGDLGSALGAVASLIKDLAPSFTVLSGALSSVFKVLENSGVFAILGNALEAVVKPLAQLINGVVTALAPALPPLIKAVALLASMFAQGLADALVLVLKALTPILTWVAQLISATVTWLSKNKLLIPVLIAVAAAIDPIGTAILLVGTLIGELATHWSAIWNGIKAVARDAWNFIYNGWGKYLLPLLGPAGLIALGVIELWQHWQTVWNALKSFTGTIWDGLKTAFDNFWGAIKNTFNTMVNGIRSAWNTIWNNTVGAVRNGISDVVNFFSGLPGKVANALAGLGSKLWSLGKTWLTDMGNGIRSVWDSVINFFKNIPSDILHALGIHSPPDWAIDAGKHIMSGLHIGMEGTLHKVLGFTGSLGGLIAGGVGSLIHSFHLPKGIPVPSGSGGSVEQLMRAMAAAIGWTGTQWDALYNVEEREAGFNLNARNASSGAYGLAQFINGPSEYYQYGGNPNTAAGQITAMFNYIKERYHGSPVAAWQHEMSAGWYDSGGWLPTGASIAINKTGRPERVVGPNERSTVVLQFQGSGSTDLERALLNWIQKTVRVKGGGDVQVAFGRS